MYSQVCKRLSYFQTFPEISGIFKRARPMIIGRYNCLLLAALTFPYPSCNQLWVKPYHQKVLHALTSLWVGLKCQCAAACMGVVLSNAAEMTLPNQVLFPAAAQATPRPPSGSGLGSRPAWASATTISHQVRSTALPFQTGTLSTGRSEPVVRLSVSVRRKLTSPASGCSCLAGFMSF